MRRRLGIDPETVLLLMVATNFQLKGMATLLRTLGRLRGRRLPVRLLVVGGKRLGPWRRKAARLGLAAAVQFVGPVEDIVPYYAAADVYVHPTIYDTCSLVVLEAAACGLPVVTTRCNGAAELFHDGDDIAPGRRSGRRRGVRRRGARACWTRRRAARSAMPRGGRRCAIPSTATWTTSWRCTRRSSASGQRTAGRRQVWTERVGAPDGEAVRRLRRGLAQATSSRHRSLAVKIGLVIDCFDPRRGGAEEWTRQYAGRLLARGHEVHVVTQSVAGGAERLPIVAHCLGPIPSHLGRAAAAEAKLRTLDLDLIHDIGMGWHCHVLQSEDGSRIAMWEHRLKLLPPWLRGIKRQMINVLPRYRDFRTLMARQFGDPERIVVAISQMCAGDFQQYHGVAPQRIRLVYHGIDIERFSPWQRERHREPVRDRLGNRPGRTGRSCSSGHDYRRKGLATAVRAVRAAGARRAPVRLLVVGGRRRETALRLLAATPDRRRHLRRPGRRSGRPIMRPPTPSCCPRSTTRSAWCVLEAAACGLPGRHQPLHRRQRAAERGRGRVRARRSGRRSRNWAGRLERLLDAGAAAADGRGGPAIGPPIYPGSQLRRAAGHLPRDDADSAPGRVSRRRSAVGRAVPCRTATTSSLTSPGSLAATRPAGTRQSPSSACSIQQVAPAGRVSRRRSPCPTAAARRACTARSSTASPRPDTDSDRNRGPLRPGHSS